ncbi:MAG: C1 family peptidase [bacterium]
MSYFNHVFKTTVVILIMFTIQVIGQKQDARDDDKGKAFYTSEEVKKMCGIPVDLDEMKNILARQDSMYREYKLNKRKGNTNSIMTIPNWKSMMNSIEYQGNCKDCWAHCATGVVEGQLNILKGYNTQVDLDELDIVNNSAHTGGCDNGDSPTTALYYIKNSKAISEVGSSPNLYGVRWDILYYPSTKISGITAIKNALNNGPVIACFYVYEDFSPFFSGNPTGIYHYNGTSPLSSSHGVVIVSYNDDDDYWLCKNSWGSGWGDGGYFKIGYGECGIETLGNYYVTVDQSCFAKIVPTLISDISTALGYSWANNEWAYVISGSHTLTSNATIASTKTLQINSSSSISLSTYSIASTGGTITIQNTASVPYTYLKQGSTYKGLHPTIASAASGASSGQTVDVYNSQSLSGNCVLPSGVSLVINSGKTITLGSYALIAPGGLTKYGSVSTYVAYIKYGTTLKGYSGTIQQGCISAPTGYTVEILSGTFSENLNFTGKSSLKIFGQGFSQTNLLGTIYAYSSSSLKILNLSCQMVYLNGCTSPEVKANIVRNGGGTALYAYNSSGSFAGNLESASRGYNPVSSTLHIYTDGVSNTCINDNSLAIYATSSSNVSFYRGSKYIELCGNSNTEYYATSSAVISAPDCNYPNDEGGIDYPRIVTTGGATVTANDNTNQLFSCPLSKRSGTYEGNSNETSISESDPISEDFAKVNILFSDLSNSVYQSISNDGILDQSIYRNDYLSIISRFKDFIKQHPESGLSKTALTTITHCYKIIDEYDAMNGFLNETMADKSLTAVKGLAKRFTIDYYNNKKEYSTSLSIADQLLKEYADDKDFTCDILYTKGVIYAHDLNDVKNAAECFLTIVNDYSDNILAERAIDELSLLGYEVKQNKEVTEGNKVEGFSINNYPNPFNPTTTIKYTIPEDGIVTLKVFDVLGREIKTLVNQRQLKGDYSVEFDASGLASGMYIYQFRMNEYVQSKKMVLLR